MCRIGAGESIDDVERILCIQMGDDLRAQPLELRLGERMVDLAPPDPVLGAGLDDDELVSR